MLESAIDMVRAGQFTALTKPDGRALWRVTVSDVGSPKDGACRLALQGLTELDSETTVTFIDGKGACDTISREAMFRGLRQANDTALPYVCITGHRRSSCGKTTSERPTGSHRGRWRASGRVDAALVRIGPRQCLANSALTSFFAFLDDDQAREGAPFRNRVHACIRVHTGNTKVCNQAGVRLQVCKVLARIARVQHPG